MQEHLRRPARRPHDDAGRRPGGPPRRRRDDRRARRRGPRGRRRRRAAAGPVRRVQRRHRRRRVPGHRRAGRHPGVTVESDDSCGGAIVRVAAGEEWDDVRRPGRRRGLVRDRGPVRHPRARRGDPGPERRRLRPGGRPDDRLGARLGPAAQRGPHPRQPPTAASPTGTRRSSAAPTRLRRARRALPAGARPSSASPSRTPTWPRALGVAPGERVPLADAREAVLALRRRKGMVLDPADHDTWSLRARSSPTRSWPRAYEALAASGADRLGPDGAAPPYPADPDGDQSRPRAAWLIEHAGFAKGYGLPGPAALSTKHTLALTNRGGATRARPRCALAREIRDGVQAAFGVDPGQRAGLRRPRPLSRQDHGSRRRQSRLSWAYGQHSSITDQHQQRRLPAAVRSRDSGVEPDMLRCVVVWRAL